MAKQTKLNRMTAAALFSALTVILQLIATFIKFGPFSITLALAPIIVGAAVYGKGFGALLGTVLGIVNLAAGIFGWDGGAVMLLLQSNPAALIIMCIGKTAAAGFLAGAVYRLIAGRGDSRYLPAVIVSGIVCPVVNTGIFTATLLLFFKDVLSSWAGGKPILTYIIVGIVGINFVIELAVNLLLSAGMTTVIKVLSKKRV